MNGPISSFSRSDLIFLPADQHLISLNAGNMLAQGLGGLLAAGILSGLEGARGIRGWRWVCPLTRVCFSSEYMLTYVNG